MMIWGGLLYLTRLDFNTVYKLSRSRDQLLDHYPQAVHAQYYRYLPLKSGWQMRPLVKAFFDFYRLLGGLRRGPNCLEEGFAEKEFVAMSRYRGSVAYEEAMLTTSDTRFVLDLIRRHDSPASIPLNYVKLEQGEYNSSQRMWHLALRDQFNASESIVRTRLVINAAGAHTDQVNQNFGIKSPFKHSFSKGVFISFARPAEHDSPLIFELGQNRDVLTFIPWGPVSCWGPTETAVHDLHGAGEPTMDDVNFLLEQANHSFKNSVSPQAIISYRSGVRPLAVSADYHAERYPLELSRHHRIHVTTSRPWISVYGGKFTSAINISNDIEKKVRALLDTPRHQPLKLSSLQAVPHDTMFPGLDAKFPSIRYCVEHEYCMTISDYLRRRTNISQWVARNGLGNLHENLSYIKQLEKQLPRSASQHPEHSLEQYAEQTQRVFNVLQGVAKEPRNE